MTHRRSNNEDGFTLVEVLVAFAILAGAVIVSFQIFAEGLRTLSAAEARRKDAEIARLEFATARASGTLAEGSRAGATDGVAWTISVQAIEDMAAPGNSSLRPYRIVVSAASGGAAEAIVVDTIELLPVKP